MKRAIMTLLFCALFCAISAQTIVWKQLESLPEGYNGGEAVSLNNEIYFVSGRTKTTKSSLFYKLNPKTNQWIKLADVPEPATNLALAAIKGKIYAIGGDLFKDINREYDPQTNTWRILEPMPTARQHIDCGFFDNNIFVMGGLTSWELISKKNEAYDIETNTWSEKAAVPFLRNCAAIVTMDSLIYVVGGGGSKASVWEKTARVDCYNANTNTWERKADLPYILYKPAAILVNNKLVVLGGSTTIGENTVTLDKTLIYNPESDEWIETTPLPSKNIFFGCTSVGNKIYVIGGTAGSESDWLNYPAVYEGELINSEVDVSYVGNAGFLIKIGDKKILVDAIFKGFAGDYILPEQIQEKLTLAQAPFDNVDLVLVTHAHGDHIDANMVLQHMKNNPNAIFASTKQTVDALNARDTLDNFHERRIGFNPSKEKSDIKDINGISIEAFYLPHGSDSRIINNGFLISVNGVSFFHTGDVDFDQFTFEEFRSLQLPEKKIDLSFIQHFYLTSDSTSRQFVNKGIGGKYIFPIHYHFTTPSFDAAIVKENYPDAILFNKELESWKMPAKGNDLTTLKGDYLGQTPPGNTPAVFARGIVSTKNLEHSAPRFSPDGTEVFWEIVRLPIVEGVSGKMIMTMQHTENGWSKPTETKDFPVFSSNGKRFYFSDLPKPNKDDLRTENQKDSENQANYIHLLAQYPELKYTRSLSIASNRNIYFMSHLEGPMNGYGIYRAELLNGEYTKPEPLPLSINKMACLNWTPFIAPDESYLLFSSNRHDPENDAGDLYISYRSGDGSWSEPLNIGAPVNTINQERFPMLSPDGKYLFFTRPTSEYDQDVFWVNATLLEDLKNKHQMIEHE